MGLTRRHVRGRGLSRNEILFPKKRGVVYENLQMTEEGEYSITKRKDGEKLIQFIKETVRNLKAKSITDMTGNVGGDTILFGLNFKRVVSYELKEDNFKALKNNVSEFGLANVELHHGDAVKNIPNIDTDVVYIDAPWGGPEYKDKKVLDLFLGPLRIDELVPRILERSSYVFLKVPGNYNFQRLKDIGSGLKKLKIRGFYIVCLFHDN
jgi:predicted RNA methylase